MPATVQDLVSDRYRPQIVRDLLAYLDDLAKRAAETPAYYPEHLKSLERGVTAFDDIRQTVRVAEDRKEFERRRAEETERLRRAGIPVERLAYSTRWGVPESGERGRPGTGRKAPTTVPWDEHAGERFRRAILLGDPGMGKSWLLRYEARRLARHAAAQLRDRTATVHQIVLPVWLRLSELNRVRKPIEDAVVGLLSEKRSKEWTKSVRGKIGNTASVLLLDAWDEITARRAELRDRLESFARRCPDQRILLASRIVGYGAAPVPGAPELVLLLFERREIESFARVWFQNQPGEGANGLLGMLEQNYTLRGLARIPLMLALMCRVYQADPQGFPQGRGELYEKCLRGLLRDWKQTKERHRERPPSDVALEKDLARLRMAAESLFRSGKEQFTQAEFAAACGTRSQKFLDRMIEDGILVPADEGKIRFLFLHRTFQEYLTACSLAERKWGELEPLLEDISCLPQWREVLILLAGRLGKAAETSGDSGTIARFISWLADAERDDVDRHHLALATLCLAEVPAAVRCPGRGLDGKLVQRVIQEGYRMGWDYLAVLARPVPPHFEGCWPALARLNWAFVGVGSRAARQPSAASALLDALHDGAWRVRLAAVEALGAIGSEAARHPEVLPVLLQVVLHDDVEIVQYRAADTLGAMASEAARHPEVLPALVAALRSDHDRVRRVAAEALGAMGGEAVRHPEVLPALLAALRDDHYGVRWIAAQALVALERAGVRIFSKGSDGDSTSATPYSCVGR